MRTLILVSLMGLAAGGQEPPTLKLSVVVNGGAEAVVAPGWPMAVNATLVASEGPVTLSVDDAHWTTGLRVSVTDPLGEVAELPLAGRVEGEATVELQEWEAASMVWWLAPEQTEGLRPGVYTVQVEFAGRTQATSRFRIGVAADANEEDREVTRLLLMSQWAEWAERYDEAEAYAGVVLARQPDSMAARLRIADVQVSAGRYREALNTLQQAEELFAGTPSKGGHPPSAIYARRRAVQGLIEAAAAK